MELNTDAHRRAKHIIRLAACHRPSQLKLKALAYIEAFILAHEDLLVAGQVTIEDAAESGCRDCRATMPEMLTSFARIGSDIGVLQMLHDSLAAVDGEFPRADSSFFNAAAAELEAAAAAADTSNARAQLERIIQNPDITE